MSLTCRNCNEPLIGDGYGLIYHCPHADEADYAFDPPDREPVDCRFDPDEEEEEQ